MKNKKQHCSKCQTMMSYRGSRMFFCPKCKVTVRFALPYTVKEQPMMTWRFTKRGK